jgi:hypothetical protein
MMVDSKRLVSPGGMSESTPTAGHLRLTGHHPNNEAHHAARKPDARSFPENDYDPLCEQRRPGIPQLSPRKGLHRCAAARILGPLLTQGPGTRNLPELKEEGRHGPKQPTALVAPPGPNFAPMHQNGIYTGVPPFCVNRPAHAFPGILADPVSDAETTRTVMHPQATLWNVQALYGWVPPRRRGPARFR